MTKCCVPLCMQQQKNPYKDELGLRIRLIMELAGLELAGLAEFTGVSESHLYAILNGGRKLTGPLADKIGEKFGLKGWKILQLDYTISANIRQAPALTEFYRDNMGTKAYFIDTLDDGNASYFIEFGLIEANLVNEPKYVWEIREMCRQAGREYKSKNLSQYLLYLSEKGKLVKEKRPLKRRDGTYADNREVYVFSRPEDGLTDGD